MFERRFQYSEAYLVGLHFPFRSGLRFPLATDWSVRYDRRQNAGAFSARLAMNFTRAWRGQLELDVLGLVGSKGEVEDGFLSTYRANDRIALGMSYVF
ncbi:MAG: hypothetical protein AB7G93_12625 [Bdellovibrionales bacterium]